MYTDCGLKTKDGQYPHYWSTGYNGDGKPLLFECNVSSVNWQNPGVWKVECPSPFNKRSRRYINPKKHGGSVERRPSRRPVPSVVNTRLRRAKRPR